MKLIQAVVAPHRVAGVIHALRHLPHFPGYTLLDALRIRTDQRGESAL